MVRPGGSLCGWPRGWVPLISGGCLYMECVDFLTPPHPVRRYDGNAGKWGRPIDEWFTPVEYVDRVCAVLGEIDLDPASHPLAQERINAKRFFTKEDDGLKHDWDKIVFCNPPYGRGQIDAFVAKLIDELSAGRVKQAILLTNNSSETDWFLRAGKACAAICFTLGRVRFYNAGRPDDDAPLQGQAFFYFGDDSARFAKVFGEVGLVFPKPMAFP